MSPSYVSRLVDGKYQVVQVDKKTVFCPYCSSTELELELSYDSDISGAHVDWYICQGCGWDVEVVDGVVQPKRLESH